MAKKKPGPLIPLGKDFKPDAKNRPNGDLIRAAEKTLQPNKTVVLSNGAYTSGPPGKRKAKNATR